MSSRIDRAQIGPSYPLGLTSFPWVDYHPDFPYSVFLAPGAAQANLPQVYWKAIGGSVDAVSARTVAHNRIYGSPIAPLGQAYDGSVPADMTRLGHPRWSIQRTVSSICTHISPTMPLPYSVNVRHHRLCGRPS